MIQLCFYLLLKFRQANKSKFKHYLYYHYELWLQTQVVNGYLIFMADSFSWKQTDGNPLPYA